MIRLTVEEMNLLSIYHEGSKAQLMENMTAWHGWRRGNEFWQPSRM